MSALLADFRVCLVTFPVGEIGGGHVLVENFLRVLGPLTREIYLITGNYPDSAIFSSKIHLTNIKHDSKRQPILIRIPKYIVTQLRISYNDEQLRTELGANARMFVSRKFDWDKTIQDWIESIE